MDFVPGDGDARDLTCRVSKVAIQVVAKFYGFPASMLRNRCIQKQNPDSGRGIPYLEVQGVSKCAEILCCGQWGARAASVVFFSLREDIAHSGFQERVWYPGLNFPIREDF